MATLVAGLRKLREQINAAYPDRDKTSDGWIGDAAHAARKSDHNPDRNGVVHALDVDEDGLPGPRLVDQLVTSRDSRLKYVIYEGRIWYPSSGWRKYTGSNPHDKHFHVSVYSGANDAAWNISLFDSWNHGLSTEQVKQIQRVLNAWYPKNVKLLVDGDYGPATTSAVHFAQTRLGLFVDGKAGPVTRKALGLKF